MNARTLLNLVARESRGSRARLGFVVACLAVGVAAVTSVTALVDGIQSSVRRDGRALLAADVAIEARRELPAELFTALAAREDATIARVTELSAMASSPVTSRLVELKAAEPGYPFHGVLATAPPGLVPSALAADEALAAPELLAGLEVAVGDELMLGGSAYRVVGSIVDEPDRVDFALTLGPRLFLSPAGLERAGLVQFGSRVNYRVLVDLPGEPAARELESFVRALRSEVPAGRALTMKTAADPAPGLSRTLRRIEDFLGLVALLSLLLGGAGVAQIVRLWMESRTPAVAVLRAIGMRPREVALVYLTNLVALALVGCALGAALGAAAPTLVATFLPELVPAGIPFPWHAALRGMALGLATAAGFALTPLTAVWRVPPARVLRAEATPLRAPRSVRWLSSTALFAVVLAAAYAQNDRGWTALAFTALVFVLAGALAGSAHLTARLAARLPRERFGPTLRHGFAALARPNSGTPAAAVALGAGVLVVVAMGLVATRLRAEFLADIPVDAPSVFLVDVQHHQSSGVQELLAAHGATGVDRTEVVMARLGALNHTPVAELLERSRGRSRWVLSREQRLTFADALPAANTLFAASDAQSRPQGLLRGLPRGLAADALWRDPTRSEVSLEVRFAEDLGVGIGDTVTFDVQGVPLELTVTTLREVDWATFRINFFVVVEPGALEGAPGWELVAARVEASREDALQAALARAHPNVSVLRLRPLLEKVTAIVERVALAVQVLGGAVALTGVAILAVAALATAARRAREAALLKVLGVTRSGVARLLAVEHALVGLIAGTLGGAGAWILAYGFLGAVLDLDGPPALWVVPAASVCGTALALVAGSAATARARAVPPLVSLRATG